MPHDSRGPPGETSPSETPDTSTPQTGTRASDPTAEYSRRRGRPPLQTMELEMGLLGGTIAEQLCDQGLPHGPLEAQKWERLREAVNLLRIHQLITDRQAHGAETKLARLVAREVGARLYHRATPPGRADQSAHHP